MVVLLVLLSRIVVKMVSDIIGRRMSTDADKCQRTVESIMHEGDEDSLMIHKCEVRVLILTRFLSFNLSSPNHRCLFLDLIAEKRILEIRVSFRFALKESSLNE